MKKIFYIISIVLACLATITVGCYLRFNHSWLGVLSVITIITTALTSLAYGIVFKARKNYLFSIPLVLAIIFAFIANIFIVKSPTSFFVLLSISQALMIATLILNSKFSAWDLMYVVAILVPVLVLTNSSQMFGYNGMFNRVIVCILMSLISALLGLSVARLIRRQNAFNATFTIASIVNLIYGFGLLVIKQSNVTHRAIPIVTTAIFAILLIVSLTLLFVGADNTEKEMPKIKTNIIYAGSILMVTLLIVYALISNFVTMGIVSPKIYKDKFMSMVGNDLNIPIVEIYTQDNEQPQSKKEYVNCSFKISNCDDETHNFSVPMAKNYEDDGCVGIRLRGNSTMQAKKRPYRIKFDEKQSLFGLKSNKSWVLLADYFDQSYIRNYTAFTLADEFDNLNFTATPHHVALMINDEFKGLYLLCEQMDEKKGRANVDDDFDITVDKEFPFLIEMDALAYMEGTTGVDNFYVESVDNHVEIKFPEADERGATKTDDPVYDYIYEYVNAVFTIIKTGEKVEVSFRDNPVGLTDLVNINSAVDYYLVNEIMFNTDSYYKSIYLHKSKDGLMEFGPIWDFDLSMTSECVLPYDKSHIEDADTLWLAKKSPIYQSLLKSEILFDGKTFYELVVGRFNAKKQAVLDVRTHLQEYKNVIDKVALIDAKMWHGITGEYQFDTQYDYVRLFLMDRYSYLDEVFALSRNEFIDLI